MSGPSRIAEVGRVVVPVTDQDRAHRFYCDVLGFETRTDSTFGPGVRWLEVAPPGATTGLALVQPREGMWGSVGVDTRISLISEDVDGDHARLTAAGADTDTMLRLGGQVPAMFFFRDPDGNTLQVTQRA
jgi:catechol 2,3-dioxygenase-like lactoylglutathione lyase family enzyme